MDHLPDDDLERYHLGMVTAKRELAQVRHGTVDFSDFEAAEKRNRRLCSGGF